MGASIHSFAEARSTDGLYHVITEGPIDQQNYPLFAFLAGVRNKFGIQPIAERRGLPSDVSAQARSIVANDVDGHSASWLSVEELQAFDYEAVIEDRAGASGLLPEGQGRRVSWRSFLGARYFEELARLSSSRAERVIFYFDN